MRALLLMAALALLVAPAAHAAPPEGFRSSGPLTVRAAKLGAPDSRVYCARDMSAWEAGTAAVGLRRIAAGYTSSAAPHIHLPPAACRVLEGWLRGKKRTVRTLAYQLFVLTHELQHTRGVRNEYKADCLAHKRFALTARAFGVKKPARVAAMKRSLQGRTNCW